MTVAEVRAPRVLHLSLIVGGALRDATGERFTYRDMFDRADTALDDATHSRRDRGAST